MLAGRHLQERMGKREKFVLTTKLIEGTDGRKMSKTYNNCVYLEDEPNEMFGKLMSIKDELIRTYFEVLTDVQMDVISAITATNPRDAKITLAKEIVKMYHGKTIAEKAAENWINTFSKGEAPAEIPETNVPVDTPLMLALAPALGESNAQIRRLIQQGAISEVSGETITESLMPIKRPMTLRIGKHRFLKITIK
jgi:tyrosyl-tRNA synthetase